MSEPTAFDLVVIGAGPGGAAAANTAAVLGRKVAIVERCPAVGGAAINTGTIPSKTLRETALSLSGLRARALSGVDLSLRREVTVEDLLNHQREVAHTEAGHLRQSLGRRAVTVVQGTGSFADPHTVQVVDSAGGKSLLRGEKIV